MVQGIDPRTGATRTIGLDAGGGWVQFQADATARLQINAAFGQDAGSGSELRLPTLPYPASPLGFYARDRMITGNLIIRSWASVVLSPEYRRIVSWPISGSQNVANVFTLSAGTVLMSRAWKRLTTATLCVGLIGRQSLALSVDATVYVRFADASAVAFPESPLVVWLSPLTTTESLRSSRAYRMVQKNKRFIPHVLVVPVGSNVEFPNLDPFFHNVFSLFNGRRFDLGLYQTGQSQAVRITREGISYIFCNIHPDMGGIILSLATPYYTIAGSGDATVRGLPPGSYKLGVWSEHATTDSLNAAVRTVSVSA